MHRILPAKIHFREKVTLYVGRYGFAHYGIKGLQTRYIRKWLEAKHLGKPSPRTPDRPIA